MLACIYLQNYLLTVALRRHSTIPADCALLIDSEGAKARVLECGVAAMAAGVTTGMSEQEARAFFPRCQVLPHDATAVDEATAALLELLESFSPSIELLAPGVALLDLGVISHTAKARAIAGKLIQELASAGYGARVGLSEDRFVASVAARMVQHGQSLLVPRKDHKRFLAPQSVHVLPIANGILRRLELLGIHTLGELTKLSESALVDQFGTLGKRLAAWASGSDGQLMNAVSKQEVLELDTEFDVPIVGGEPLFQALQLQLVELFNRLRERGQLATRLRLLLYMEGEAQPLVLVLGFAAPHRQAERVLTSLRQRLNSLVVPAPLTRAECALEGLVMEYARQLTLHSLFPKERRWQGIERVLERLQTREEAPLLMSVVWDQPTARVPERRAHLQDRVLPARGRSLYVPKPMQVVTDAAGVPHLVRTRTRWVGVEWVMESWELEDDWWTSRPLQRSYYRVVLKDGAILRLFRDEVNGGWFHQTR